MSGRPARWASLGAVLLAALAVPQAAADAAPIWERPAAHAAMALGACPAEAGSVEAAGATECAPGAAAGEAAHSSATTLAVDAAEMLAAPWPSVPAPPAFAGAVLGQALAAAPAGLGAAGASGAAAGLPSAAALPAVAGVTVTLPSGPPCGGAALERVMGVVHRSTSMVGTLLPAGAPAPELPLVGGGFGLVVGGGGCGAPPPVPKNGTPPPPPLPIAGRDVQRVLAEDAGEDEAEAEVEPPPAACAAVGSGGGGVPACARSRRPNHPPAPPCLERCDERPQPPPAGPASPAGGAPTGMARPGGAGPDSWEPGGFPAPGAGPWAAGTVLAFAWWRPRRGPAALAALFSRLTGDDIAGQPTRTRILGQVREAPGIHFNELARRLGCGRGALQYHLEVLRRGGHVQVRKSGRYVCVYPPEVQPDPAEGLLKTPLACQVEALVRRQPGIAVKEAARRLGVSYAAAAYHLRRLAAAGFVQLRGAPLAVFPLGPPQPAAPPPPGRAFGAPEGRWGGGGAPPAACPHAAAAAGGPGAPRDNARLPPSAPA